MGFVLWSKKLLLILVGILGSVNTMCVLAQEGSACWKKESEGVVLPVSIPGTTLLLREIISYEGGFLEDGNREHVENIAAVLLENVGSKGIEHACVELRWEDGSYSFNIDMLPAESSIIVLERNAKAYVKQPWVACNGIQRTSDASWWTEGVVIENTGMCELLIKNTTNQSQENLQLYFKDKVYQEDILLGGITYCVDIGDLPAGGSVLIKPYRFVNEYSQILSLRRKTTEKVVFAVNSG